MNAQGRHLSSIALPNDDRVLFDMASTETETY